MIRVILILVVGMLIFLVVRLVKLLLNYSAGSKNDIEAHQKEKDEIRKHFENIEEAEFRDIKSEDDDVINEKDE